MLPCPLANSSMRRKYVVGFYGSESYAWSSKIQANINPLTYHKFTFYFLKVKNRIFLFWKKLCVRICQINS
jgi:hypothetical protein